jgi:lipopolysaccharide transport system ATP-binding protein
MSSNVAIRARALSKTYSVRARETEATTLGEILMARMRRPLQRRPPATDIRALDAVTIEVEAGQVLGLIGRNGSGKSTLLKVLARITPPSAGRAEVFGRVGTLLEVGTGFHPELTGRENIFLNGAILGMKKVDVKKQFEEIVAFAGNERFLDSPVKRYSSGMYVRLAFAVAAHLAADILLVDEALAVGDLEFQRKCFGKMQDLATSGRTIVFVSHAMTAISSLCSTAVYLDRGHVAAHGPVHDVVARYVAAVEEGANLAEPDSRPGTGELRIVRADAARELFASAEPKTFEVTIAFKRPPLGEGHLVAVLRDSRRRALVRMDSRAVGVRLNARDAELSLTMASPALKPGPYTLDLQLVGGHGLIDEVEGACGFTVMAPPDTDVIVAAPGAEEAVLAEFTVSDPSLIRR